MKMFLATVLGAAAIVTMTAMPADWCDGHHSGVEDAVCLMG